MSIGVHCRDCGRTYQVEDSFAGGDLQCFNCGSTIAVPGAPKASKVCTVCKRDLAKSERIADPQGNYYCQSCWQASLAAYKALPAKVQAAQSLTALSRAAARRRQAPPPSDIGKLVTGVFNTRRTKREKRVTAAIVLGLLTAAWFWSQVAVTVWAALLVLGVSLAGFYGVWQLGLPFGDGASVGLACLTNSYRRNQWRETHRDHRLRQPRRVLLLSLLSVALSIVAYRMSIRSQPGGFWGIENAPTTQPSTQPTVQSANTQPTR